MPDAGPRAPGRIAVAVLAFWAMMLVAVSAGATERSADEVSRITREVSESVESPFCPGQSLAMCPSGAAADTRREIQKMAREGKDADEIKEILLERHGEQYKMTDPSTGDQMTLLGGIIGGFAIAIGVVSLLARRRLTGDEEDPDAEDGGGEEPGPEDESYLEELRAEYRE